MNVRTNAPENVQVDIIGQTEEDLCERAICRYFAKGRLEKPARQGRRAEEAQQQAWQQRDAAIEALREAVRALLSSRGQASEAALRRVASTADPARLRDWVVRVAGGESTTFDQ